MKICIEGAQETNKAKIATGLAKHLNIPVLPDSVNSAKDRGYLESEKSTLEDELQILSEQLMNEKRNDNFVTNKGLLNILAHVKLISNVDFTNAQFMYKLVKTKLLKRAYDEILFLQYDGPDKQKSLIQVMLLKIIRELRIPYSTVRNLKEAISQIEKRTITNPVEIKPVLKTTDEMAEKVKQDSIKTGNVGVDLVAKPTKNIQDPLDIGNLEFQIE